MTTAAPLAADEIARYARHIVLPEIGGPGQQRLKAARVLVIGAGGLGAPALQYLAAAGVGTLGIVDDDTVSLSNLQRQVIHATRDIGRPKVESAAAAIDALNPHVQVVTHAVRLGADNAEAIFKAYDLVVDGSDNFETRYLAADTAETAAVPLVTGAVGRFDGSLTVLKPYETDAEGHPNPSYRDLFPSPPPPGAVPSCAEAGIIGALTGVIGTLQAMEAIKLVTGIGEPLVGRLLLYDALTCQFNTIRYRRGNR
ncbi:molybdopterin-synthase adenylyltransferase MoeB [Sinorhizobium saheli]|uniref:Molybdopterin-synthase adenylyltransferase n=1 Tax=Sinorhizobium saheli TaxID=36856 RepID=A0A178YHQ2_SINSA|nr:molybdopterin-synthase adenylyltransferase MoeB [Sinorhizobium saheli]MQW89222.1 molybdopterin-synthase adenylyltransferase MoeB [Sinorhizobium saheli]OAP46951.1 thiamine biosynthesis protein ThiF [Sinorhizobium saheli]